MVRRAIHAGVELDDAAIEARDRAGIAGRRMADHQPCDAELLQQRQQHVGFGRLVAQRSAAVPVGTVLREQDAVGGRVEALDRVGQRRIRRAAVRSRSGGQAIPRELRPGVVLVARLQQLRLLELPGEPEIIGERRAIAQVQFLRGSCPAGHSTVRRA